MGFGIALIGYGFLLLHEFGGGILAALFIGYGFFLASKLNAKFMYAAVTALFLVPRGTVLFLSIIKVVDRASDPVLNWATFILNVLAWMTCSVFWMGAVLDIARENNAQKLAGKARRQIAVTVSFLTLTIALQVVISLGAELPFIGQILNLQYVLQYCLIIYNALFLHTCFVMITSEKEYQKDLQSLASERATELERRHKESIEEAKRNEKRRR